MGTLAEIPGHSPDWFPYVMDAANDTVSFIRLRAQDYSNAGFLDPRLLTPQTRLTVLPWPQVISAVETMPVPERCAFIFHIGHVGSTLLSRLMGAHPNALSLREPLLLRQFAQSHNALESATGNGDSVARENRLGTSLKLLSRTYHARQLTVVKATSFVSEMAGDLLARPSAPRAIMLIVSPETYLATIFGGPNSRHEAQVLAPARLRRLQQRLGYAAPRWDRLSEGQTLAVAWACEASGLAAAANENTLCMDFDRFLADPLGGLSAALQHVGLQVSRREVLDIIRGPLMSRYSKALEHAYDAALRSAVLDAARAGHGAEIRRGLEWLEKAAADFAPIARALALARRCEVGRP